MMENGRPMVLLIDDDPVARLLAREALEQSGWSVEEAENGRHGLEVFLKRRPDLILLDIMMPEMDGFTVCAELRKLPEGIHTPVLIMTGLEDYQSITQAYDAGATDFIVKPVNGLLLGHRVRYMLRAGQAMRDLRDSQDKLMQARDAALEGTRLKSEFLGTISHEIRTPMNGIIGMDELLLDTELSSEQRDYAETIRTSAKALLDIVNDILDFSKLDTGRVTLNRVEFSLPALVDEHLARYDERSKEKGIVLRREIASTIPPTLWGDQTHIGRILQVLLSNAMKFTERGEVSVHVCPAPQILARGPEKMGAGRIRFAVADTGIGINPTDANRLFQPFVQVDGSDHRQYGGTGLGLALAKQLVELMGGTIEFESNPGRGSRFWFDLPVARASDRMPEAAGPRVALVYVKEVVSQAVIRRTLEKLEYHVQTLADVEDLVKIGPEVAPILFVVECNLLVLETARKHVQRLKERFPRLRILGLVHESFSSEILPHLPFHIDGHLGKPLTVDAIKSAVEASGSSELAA
ncbi:MAG: response regulator [Nitrospira sp.]|nr:MAG: response regulator [Nitrospira sp.]